ncbi:glutamyl-tRNA reductase [Fistulifera solaris]|uniref:Glutamyl-tRNA reductase n=1 Tax=Fistulifera solaris TaxID=1519565 RepID=A0A1Z5KC28_FISSO|nr:glutamyl-tRNA reductase [Fistulifera solaris]|eukprot:GAX23756.1 glutamyl-tRNA reductase [Fistulifera solaris]
MKFVTSVLVCVVAIAPVSAFVAPLPSVAITSTASPLQQLSMIATGEMINGETKKKTREERLEAATKGLQVHVVGLSIHHAEVEVREKLAIPEAEWNAASNEICANGKVNEAAVLSTCNRFEVYYAATDARAAMAHVTQYLSERSGIPVSSLRRNLFMLSGDDAVWHIMRVAGGLDSLIVGEGQILSQVRQCHLHSIEEDGCGGKVLSRLLNNAVAAGKRVRSETAISKGSVSISSAAVELSEMLSMKDLKLPFSECRLAAVGAGKMTRLLITHLASRGLEKITIVNRSLDRPKELQEQFPDIDIEIKLMDDLWDVVGRSDIVYTATSCVDYVIDEHKLDVNGLVGGRPLMLVDISVPRNVNENCNEIPNVKAYNVDDLKAVVARNTAMRQREILEAEKLLQEEAESFIAWREALSTIPTIYQLQERANEFRQEELKKCTRRLSNANLSDKELEAVERLSRGIVNKLLHGPMAHLRKTESIEGKQATLKELSAMFMLEQEENNSRKRRNGRARR